MGTKRSNYIFFLSLLNSWIFFADCSKQFSQPVYSAAALNIVNALPNSSPLIPVQGPISTEIGDFSNISALPYGNTFLLTTPSESEEVYAVQQNSDTVSLGSKAGDFIFSSTLSVAPGGLYSLFITGADTSSPDYLFVRDTPPLHGDSTIGIRFINLSAGSNPVSVDIQGQPNGSTASSLAYKSTSSFSDFAATSPVSSYIFEFRDVTSGNLLASYTLNGVNTVLFKNLTIALIGQPPGGTVAQTCMQENNF